MDVQYKRKKKNARVIDTSMFLYKVSNQEGKYSYLFGTCHPGRYPIKSLDKNNRESIRWKWFDLFGMWYETIAKKKTEEITKIQYVQFNSWFRSRR